MEKEEYDTIFGTFGNDNGNPQMPKFKYECEPCAVTWRAHKPRSKCWVCKGEQVKIVPGLV